MCLRSEGDFATYTDMARTDQPHKLTFDKFVAQVTDFTNPLNEKHKELDYSKPETRAAWGGAKVKIPIWCNVHGEFFTQQPANHRDLGQGCPQCGKKVYKDKRRKADPIADFRKVHGDLYDYSRVVYENAQSKIEIVCPAHGPFWQKANAHLSGNKCPGCELGRRVAYGKERTQSYRDNYALRAAKVHNGAYAILSLPEHSHDWVDFHCARHGNFRQQAHSHLLGHGCPRCGKITSYTQMEIAAFIESLGAVIEHENKTVLDGLHIDIWCPEKRLGLEYHGQFWHTAARVGNKHREKWERANAAGARLIQMFDFEWLENRTACENRLRALFGREAGIGARTCTLERVDRAAVSAFLKEQHTQGVAPRATHNYVLKFGTDIVAVMTFGQNRFREGWELLRFASKGRVQGGFSRMLKAFVADTQAAEITSYCDLRWGDGTVYAANDFTLDGVTEPDYWYADRERRVSRYSAQRRPAGQTEREWADENGYEKVYGVGHQRWVWRA